MLHSMGRPYPCPVCQKCFRSSNNLREHLRIHTGERPYKCRICDLTFTTSGTRGRHEKIHGAALRLLKIGKKRFSCTRCSEQFSGAAARIKHMKKHHLLTGQYFCIQCDIELASVEELLDHHNVVHTDGKGKNIGVSSLTAEHEDHAYHRCPLNNTNTKGGEGLASNEPDYGNLVSKRSKGYSRIQRKSLLNLRRICLKARERNAGGSDSEFVCRYCTERFLKLPLFLKHLWKHSKAKSDVMMKSDQLVKHEIAEEDTKAEFIVEDEITDDGNRATMSEEVEVIEGDDIIVEGEFFGDIPDEIISIVTEVVKRGGVATESQTMDGDCQSVIISSEIVAEADGKSEETHELQQFVEELVLCKYRCELEDEHLHVKTETFSPGSLAWKKAALPDQPANQNPSFRDSNCDLEELDSDSISSSHSGRVVMCEEMARITADDKDTVYDEVVCPNNNSGDLIFSIPPNYIENNPESLSDLKPSVRVKSGLDNSQIFCELCGKRIKSLDQIETGNDAVHTCAECDQLFSSLQQLQDGSGMDALESLSHDVQDGMVQKPKRESNSLRKTYSCGHCNEKLNSRKLRDLHERTCAGETAASDDSSTENSTPDRRKLSIPYSCTVCSRPFAFKYRLQRHMLTHTGEKPFKCKVCGKAYTSNEYLKSHTARHFNEYTHLCSTCGKSFADRLAWRLHKRVHEIAKRTKSLAFKEYMCWLCGFQFRHASNLTKHLQRHRLKDEYAYKCGECDQQFRTKEGVRFHVGTHALDKPYLCMECPKSFPDAWCLKIHSRSHTKLGSFECSVCGKKLRTMSSLRTHSRHHIDLQYTCGICGETFGFSRKYRSHLIKHRPPFQCDVCGITTTRAAGLRKHKKRFQHFQ